MNKLINWIINSGSVTDWIMVIFLGIPLLILLNDKVNITKRFKKLFNKVKNLIIDKYNIFKLLILKLKIKNYLLSLDTTSQFNFSKVKIKKGSILIISRNNNSSFTLYNHDLVIFEKYKLSKIKKSLPIELSISILVEMKDQEINIGDFTRNGRLSQYESDFINNKKIPSL